MMPSERAARERELEHIAHWMDEAFRVPGTDIRFGLDPILGLIPGVGDTAAALVGAYLIGKARAVGMPFPTILHMVWNVIVDWVVGTIPLLGDIFDIGFKANRRNVELIKRHLAERSNPPIKDSIHG